jgi:hypothetical protein
MAKKLAGSGRFKSRKAASRDYAGAPPKIHTSIETIYLAVNQDLLEKAATSFQDQIVISQIIYRPGILAIGRVTFEGTRWEIFHERDVTHVTSFPAAGHMADWEKNLVKKPDPSAARPSAEPNSSFDVDANVDFSPAHIQSLQEQYVEHLTTTETLELTYNPHLRLYRKLDETEDMFLNRCLDSLRDEHDQERKQLEETILRREERLKERLEREYREHGVNPADVQAAIQGEQVSGLEAQPTVLTAASLDEVQAALDVQDSVVHMGEIQRELVAIQKEKVDKLQEFEESLITLAKQREKDIVRVNRGNVKIMRFAVLWLPFTEFIIQEDSGRRIELIQSFA